MSTKTCKTGNNLVLLRAEERIWSSQVISGHLPGSSSTITISRNLLLPYLYYTILLDLTLKVQGDCSKELFKYDKCLQTSSRNVMISKADNVAHTLSVSCIFAKLPFSKVVSHLIDCVRKKQKSTYGM